MFEKFLPSFNKKKPEINQEPSEPQLETEIRELDVEKEQSDYERAEEKTLTLIKVFVEDNDLDSHETDNLFSELKVEAERLLEISGDTNANPAATLEKIQELLHAKATNIIEDYHRFQYGQSKKQIDDELVKKAKIILLANHDFSDLKKGFSSKEMPAEPLEYLNDNRSDKLIYYLNLDQSKLNANEGRALMATGYEKALMNIEFNRSGLAFKEMPDELLLKIAEEKTKNDFINISLANILDRDVIDKQGASRETMRAWIKAGFGSAILKKPEPFLKNAQLEDWQYLIKYYSPDYPYHIDDIIYSLKNIDLPENQKKELADYAFKNCWITLNSFNYSRETDPYYQEYFELFKKEFLNKEKGKYYDEKKEPAELNEEEIKELKKLIADGYLGMVDDKYLQFLSNTDHDWFIGTVRKNEQENLLLNHRFLNPEEEAAYAQKLFEAGEIRVISKLIEKNSFSQGSLPAEIFTSFLEKGIVTGSGNKFLDPEYFKDLDNKNFIDFKETFGSNEYSFNETLFKKINCFKLDPTPENKDYLAYQKLTKYVKETYESKASTVYSYLDLKFSYLKNASHCEEILSSLIEKTNLVEKNIEKIFASYPPEKRNFRQFIEKMDLSILKNDLATLENDLETLVILNEIKIEARQERLEFFRDQSLEEKRAIADLLNVYAKAARGTKFSFLKFDSIFPLIERIKNLSLDNLNKNTLAQELNENFGIDFKNFANQEEINKIELYKEIAASLEKNILARLESEERQSLEAYKAKVLKREDNLKGKENDYFVRIMKKYMLLSPLGAKEMGFKLNYQTENETEFTEKNWAEALVNYIFLAGVEDENSTKAKLYKELMSGPYRDVCLKNMTSEWREFLDNEEQNEAPFKLSIISQTISHFRGAGNLSRVESLAELINAFNNISENDKTASRTQVEIKNLLKTAEERFEKEKWSLSDKAYFYQIAKDTIKAAPSLFSSFAPLLNELSGKEMKQFFKDIMPLYQTKLVSLQDTKTEQLSYNPRDLVELRKTLNNFSSNLKTNPNHETVIKEEKTKLENDLRASFKDRLGIISIPEKITQENIRSIRNVMLYLSNLSKRNEKNEALLSLYLGLELNKDWAKFRTSKNIKADKYLTQEKAAKIKDALTKKIELPLDIIGVNKKDEQVFQKYLQAETVSSMVGNLETIDVKLGNAKRNIDELLDPDIYEDKKDQELIEILKSKGKLIGSTLAKTYQELNGRNVNLTPDERELQQELKEIMEFDDWSLDRVKETQDRIQPLSLINDLIKSMNDSQVEENISDLESRLNPEQDIIHIFNRLDEGFKPQSGAFALNRDLEYLEQLTIKGGDKLSPEEKTKIDNYLNRIREKMMVLENIMSTTQEYFSKIKNSAHLKTTDDKSILKNRLSEMEKILSSHDGQEVIITEMTTDPNLIIENMRQCLGCLRREANNDTNLAFGDYNKFFLMSRKEKNRGSEADQIVFLAPIKNANQDSGEMSFILDKVYGSKTSDILIAHILTVYKKYKAIKNNFPEAKISLSVTQDAMLSAGISEENLAAKLKEKLDKNELIEFLTDLEADIPESSLGDNYIEFGKGSARESGKRRFMGLKIGA